MIDLNRLEAAAKKLDDLNHPLHAVVVRQAVAELMARAVPTPAQADMFTKQSEPPAPLPFPVPQAKVRQ